MNQRVGRGELKKRGGTCTARWRILFTESPGSCFLGSERKKFQDRRQNMSSGDGG